jgi:hypothetical protein
MIHTSDEVPPSSERREKTILSMFDPIALDSWTAQAACKTMDEFAEGLR